MAEYSVANYYLRAASSMLPKMEVWGPTDLELEEEGAGWRVAIGLTLQRHIISFYDGPLRHNLEANLFRWI